MAKTAIILICNIGQRMFEIYVENKLVLYSATNKNINKKSHCITDGIFWLARQI